MECNNKRGSNKLNDKLYYNIKIKKKIHLACDYINQISLHR